MFNKEENLKINKVELNNKDFYKQYNNISITPFFVIMLNKYYEDKKTHEHLDLDKKIKLYIENSFEYQQKKQYNEVINKLYHSGKILINDHEYKLKDFYIVYNDNLDFYLLCTDNNYQNEEVEYRKSVKFIDTTAFIELIKNEEVENNKIIVKNQETLREIIKKWDGLLHDEVSETDAIMNKNMIGNE